MPDPRLPSQLHSITADCIRYHKPRCLINTDDDDANNYLFILFYLFYLFVKPRKTSDKTKQYKIE